jgi:hypothetical protein
MGCPINSFNVMCALLNTQTGWLGDKFHRMPHRELSDLGIELRLEFKLLAFVLHSPVRHLSLHHKLERDFGVLDKTTGKDLLFFAVVEPSRDWLGEERHYFSKLRCSRNYRAQGLACEDSDTALCALARAFSVTKLPAIVVVDTENPEERVVLPTSAEEIEQQLTRLGACAQRFQSGNPLAAVLEEWRLENVNQLSSQSSVAVRAVLALAGVAVREPGRGMLERINAQDILRSHLDKSFYRFQRASPYRFDGTTDATGNEQVLDDPCEYEVGLLLDFAFYLGVLADESPRQEDLFSDVVADMQLLSGLERNRLEMEASAALASADAILRAGTRLEDFSPLLICIGTAFESEINASLVQWYRQELGVPMPVFFKAHAPGVAALVDGERPVDFNARRRHSEWFPPSMGATLWAGVQHFNARQPQELNAEGFRQLVGIWKAILDLRNRAGHPGVMERPEFLEGVSSWRTLRKTGLLASLLALKERLSR